MDMYIGCSGFHYADWKKKFYPKNLPKKDWLDYYAGHFKTVEINHTFYKMPSRKDLKHWKAETPDDFKFSIKANRLFTHLKKLKTDKTFTEHLKTFQDSLHTLEEKLGCILWQLPGNLHKSLEKLGSFVERLDQGMDHAVEFRHGSWFDDTVYEILSDNGIAFCMISAPDGLPEEPRATCKTAYLRFHGKCRKYSPFVR